MNTAGNFNDPYDAPPAQRVPAGPSPWGSSAEGPYGHLPHGPASYGHPPVSPAGTNALAVASLVLGILWLYWIGSILALVLGYTARSQIRARGGQGDGMAVAGIVLGWAGVGVFGAMTVLFVLAAAAGSGW
jgi:hypothetical protein